MISDQSRAPFLAPHIPMKQILCCAKRISAAAAALEKASRRSTVNPYGCTRIGRSTLYLLPQANSFLLIRKIDQVGVADRSVGRAKQRPPGNRIENSPKKSALRPAWPSLLDALIELLVEPIQTD